MDPPASNQGVRAPSEPALEPIPILANEDSGKALETGNAGSRNDTPDMTPDLAEQPEHGLHKWNSPPINKYRVLATFWSFFIFGMNDGSYGGLIPHLEPYYHLNHTIVSLVFLSPFAGYTVASVVNNLVHVNFGQRGVAIVAPLCHVISFLVISFHPPYPVAVVICIFVGFGNGLADAAWCAWIGTMENSHEMSGLLQASYALGATVAPLIITALTSSADLGWWTFYYIMVGTSVIELLTSAYTFWDQTAAVYLAENPLATGGKSGRTREVVKLKITWLFVLFVFGYCGAEVSIGGWIVVFMRDIRGGSSFAGGAAATGFWGGMTLGRLLLPFVTSRVGEQVSMLSYLALTIVLELIFWLVPNLVASAVAVALLGFFMGPLFPTAVVLITKLLPRSLHVGTIGFATAGGGSGGAILPFAVGAIAQAAGVQTLQPIILAIFVLLAVLWFILPWFAPKDNRSSDTGVAMEHSSTPEKEVKG